ncbi:LysE family transporter [Marinospirillum sp.]|uniref:LysE family transporter n=1 Tax=Marinospirillum sp. TaxID=2183934 RepID=UPI003A86BF7E
MSWDIWLTFFMTSWVISLSPGAGAVASMSAGLNYGFRVGYWNAIGLQIALILQLVIAAAGLGALLMASEWAFGLVKWCGIAYLLYLGWKQWNAPVQLHRDTDTAVQAGARWGLVWRGFVVNASNPKAIVFILAVLPQFLDPQQPLLEQYVLMGLTMVVVDLIVMAGYTGLAAKVLGLLQHPRHQALLNKTFGGTFIAAGLLLTSAKSS